MNGFSPPSAIRWRRESKRTEESERGPGWRRRELFCASFCLKMGKRFTMHSSTGGIRERKENEDQLL